MTELKSNCYLSGTVIAMKYRYKDLIEKLTGQKGAVSRMLQIEHEIVMKTSPIPQNFASDDGFAGGIRLVFLLCQSMVDQRKDSL